MGTNTLTTIGTASPVKATGDLVDQYKTALTVDLIPRNSSGSPTTQAGSLGSSTYVWNSAFVDNLKLDGNTISSTDTNGDINLSPNGTGAVVIDNIKIDGNTNTISAEDTNGNINLSPNGDGAITETASKTNFIRTVTAVAVSATKTWTFQFGDTNVDYGVKITYVSTQSSTSASRGLNGLFANNLNANVLTWPTVNQQFVYENTDVGSVTVTAVGSNNQIKFAITNGGAASLTAGVIEFEWYLNGETVTFVSET